MSETKSGNRVLEFINSKSKVAIVGAVTISVIALLAAGGLFWYKYANKNILVTVGNKKITTTDLNKAIYGMDFSGSPDSPRTVDDTTKTNLLNNLVENEVVVQKAKELGITVTDQEINDEIASTLQTAEDKKDGFEVYSKYTQAQKDQVISNVRPRLLKAKIKDKVLAWNEGDFMLVRFDKYNEDLPDMSKVTLTDESKRASLKAELKVKAETAAKRLYDELQSGVAWDTVTAELVADKEVGMPALGETSPMMVGGISKSDYQDDIALQGIAQINSFNELATINADTTSAPLLLKDNNGKELPFYVIYKGQSSKDGYKWGYANWFAEQKASLVSTSNTPQVLLSVLKALKPAKAFAFANDACGSGGVMGHGYCFTAKIYYLDKSGNEVRMPNYPLKIGNSGSAYTVQYNKAGVKNASWVYPTSTNDGILYFSYNTAALFDANGQSDDDDAYGIAAINCNKAGVFNIFVNGSAAAMPGSAQSPGLAGSDPTKGTWGRTGAYGTNSGEWTGHSTGFGIAKASPRLVVCMRKDYTGLCKSTITANGNSATIGFRWYPFWQLTNYNLAVNVVPPEAAEPVGAGSYAANSSVVASFSGVQQDYTFNHWSDDCVSAGANPTATVVMDRDKTCTANFDPPATVVPTKSLSCTVNPETGLAPLVVKVDTVASGLEDNSSFTYYMGDSPESILSPKPATLYFTYSAAGEYLIKVSNPDYSNGDKVNCSVNPVTVTDPTDGDGGEVNPN